MNKSILKHEIKSLRWVLLLSLIGNFLITMIFSISLDNEYRRLFFLGIRGNEALAQDALRGVIGWILAGYAVLSIIQVFMQFRSEKNQEVGRFLKSLPVNRNEFFRIKLVSGIINISLGFIVLIIGLVLVRSKNMFWIKDVHNISLMPDIYMKADGIGSLIKETGLVYLITLTFYTFIFMIQYTFSNLIGGIVTGILVWLSPMFIIISLGFTINTLSFLSGIATSMAHALDKIFEWVFPWRYIFSHDYRILFTDKFGRSLANIMYIENIEVKYIVSIIFILTNILVAYKLNQSSKVENENMLIPFKISRNIFKIGVTICSSFLLSIILIGLLSIQINDTLYIFLMIVGGSIGYFISNRIAKVE